MAGFPGSPGQYLALDVSGLRVREFLDAQAALASWYALART